MRKNEKILVEKRRGAFYEEFFREILLLEISTVKNLFRCNIAQNGMHDQKCFSSRTTKCFQRFVEFSLITRRENENLRIGNGFKFQHAARLLRQTQVK